MFCSATCGSVPSSAVPEDLGSVSETKALARESKSAAAEVESSGFSRSSPSPPPLVPVVSVSMDDICAGSGAASSPSCSPKRSPINAYDPVGVSAVWARNPPGALGAIAQDGTCINSTAVPSSVGLKDEVAINLSASASPSAMIVPSATSSAANPLPAVQRGCSSGSHGKSRLQDAVIAVFSGRGRLVGTAASWDDFSSAGRAPLGVVSCCLEYGTCSKHVLCSSEPVPLALPPVTHGEVAEGST